MDKSRNNEFHINSTKRKLFAIEKNENIIEESKSLYVKRSLYSTKYKEYPIDRFDNKKKVMSCKNKLQCSLLNYSLPKSNSILLINTKKLPIVSKKINSANKMPSHSSNNIKLVSKQQNKNQKQKINDLFFSVKLKNNPKMKHIKNTNNKCLMYIEDLLNKSKGEKSKTLIALSKEAEKDQRLFFFDQDLPSKYRSHSMYQINIRPRAMEKSAHSSTIKIKYCDKLVNSISRKITLYNDKNEYIGEEVVANKLQEEVDNKSTIVIYNKTNSSNVRTNSKTDKTFINRENSFILKDFEIDPQILFPQSSPASNYKEIMHNKKHIQNRLIRRELKRKSSSSLYKTDQQIIMQENNRNNFKEKQEIKLLSNKGDIDESNNDYINMNYSLNSLTMKYMNNSLIPSLVSKPIETPCKLKNSNDLINNAMKINKSKKTDNEIQDTVRTLEKIQDTARTLEKIHPKGLNQNIIIKPNSVSSIDNKNPLLLVKENKSRVDRKYIDIQKKYHDLDSFSNVNPLVQQQSKEDLFKALLGNNSNVSSILNSMSLMNFASKIPSITKIKKKSIMKKSDSDKMSSIEEAKRKQEQDEREQKKLEEETEKEKDEHQKLLLEQERIDQLTDDYQKYVRRKIAEEEERKRRKKEAKESAEASLKETKEKEDEPKSSFLSILNTSNQECLLSHCQPKTPIKSTMILKKHYLLGSHIDLSLIKKRRMKNDNKSEKESFDKKYKSRKGSVEKEINKEDNKKRALLKLKNEINYVFQDCEDSNDNENTYNVKDTFNEFKDKLKSLKNFNEQDYVAYLENNYEEIQEEIETLKQTREEENRINSFLRDMDYSLNNTRDKKKCLQSHFKILGPKCSYSASSLLQ